MAKISRTKLLNALKADLKSAETLRKDTDGKISEWSDAFDGRPYGNESPGKSAIISKDIKKQAAWQHASIIDPFLASTDIVKITPVTAEDVKAARQSEIMLNAQFCRQFNRYSFMTKSVKVLEKEGTVVVQTGWDYQDEEVEVDVPLIGPNEYGIDSIIGTETIKETKVTVNKPTATVCRNEDIYIDPTCMDDMDKCQFVIYRFETDMSTLRQDGRYKNLEKLRSQDGNDVDFDGEDETNFMFEDDPRKKLVVYEYWGNYDMDEDGITEPIVCSWVGDTIIRLGTNPYPDKKPPFIVVPFNSVPFQMYGEANAELIGDNQRIKTAITRGIIDNMAQSNNGQKGIRKGALDVQNRRKFLRGENFEFNGTPNDFWDGSYNQIPGSAFDMLGLMNNDIESITGIKGFSGGITGSSLGNMLDVETDIPLIDGSWKKLRDVIDGDKLIGSDGECTKVLKAHKVKLPVQAYDMTFDDKAVVKSGGEHLWTVKVHGTSHELQEWTTITADEVYAHIENGEQVTIPKMKELHVGTPENSSVDPYVKTVELTSMIKVDKVPMRCLTVDSADKLFAVTKQYILTHNTATGARGALDAASTRRMNVVRNISENMIKPLMRKWLAYNGTFLNDTEIVRYTNDEFIEIRRDDLSGAIDLEIGVSTAEDNAAKAQEITFMLQTMGQSMTEEMRHKILAQWADLTKQPELAHEFRNFKAPVNPAIEEMRQLEIDNARLTNEKLKAEVAAIYAASKENIADETEKLAAARVKNAQADKLIAEKDKVDSERDLVDLTFLERDNQVDKINKMEELSTKHTQEMDKEKLKHIANIRSMAFQARQGDQNIGVTE